MEAKAKILVVDDEPEFFLDLQFTLEEKGYSVSIASNQKKAKELAEQENPDLILLGTVMPRGDAFVLNQWLRNSHRFRDIPILVLDAPLEKQWVRGWRRDEGLRLEAEDYFCKPVNTAHLITTIEKLIDRSTRRIKVLVADDHEVVREGIRALLSLQKDMQVVGEAIDGQDAVEKTIYLSPDIVLMDILMPKMNGLEATKQICKKCKEVKVLMLTQYDDEENVLASRQVGASGFISKRGASTQLLAAIRSAQA